MSEVKQEAQEKLAESTQTLPQSTAAQQSDNVAHALAGAGGGLLSMALTYPLITLSTRAQVESKRAQSSTLGAARRIIKREGITGLYAGMDSALFGITVTNFVYYYCTSCSLQYTYGIKVLTVQGMSGLAPSLRKLHSSLAAPLKSLPLSNP